MNHITTAIRVELCNVSADQDQLLHERLMRPQQAAIRTAYRQLLQCAEEKPLWHLLRERFPQVTGRSLNDAILTAKAILKSQRELLPVLVQGLQERIDQAQKRLSREQERAEGARPERVTALQRRITRLSDERTRLDGHVRSNTVPPAKFGGRKTWRDALRQVPGARELWRERRTRQFLSRGAANHLGNPHCRLIVAAKGQLQMMIRVPTSVIVERGRQTTQADWQVFDISYSAHSGRDYDHLLRQAAADGMAKTGQYTVRLLRLSPRCYRAYVTLEEPVAHREYSVRETLPDWCTALGGVDLNLDHLAIVVTDKDGQFGPWETLRYPNLGELPRSRTRWEIGNIAREAIAFLKENHAHALVLEDLKFKDKEEHSAKFHRRTVPFPYRQLSQALTRAALRNGLAVKLVHPAYTSWIGQLKYSGMYGIGVHVAAAYVIARRGHGLQERLPKGLIAKFPDVLISITEFRGKWPGRLTCINQLRHWHEYSPEAGYPWKLWASLKTASKKVVAVRKILTGLDTPVMAHADPHKGVAQ